MVILHLFIDYHYKSIVSIIRERHVLTLHLSTANCRRKLTTGCCCKNAAALYCTCYAIFLPELWPISKHFDGTLILLYFIEMLPRTVSKKLLVDPPLKRCTILKNVKYLDIVLGIPIRFCLKHILMVRLYCAFNVCVWYISILYLFGIKTFRLKWKSNNNKKVE